KRYGLTVLAIKGDAEFEINPDPNQPLYKDMLMVIIGSNPDIDRLPI
ncbi:MAG: TrkA family potassium uptake protein, partial [Moorea sp. SIO4G2]|nr:TrkA family potassium uptake protein [Moorena sp. SIO4G2]